MTAEEKEKIAKAYKEMGFINLGFANNCLIIEEQAYKKGCEYIEKRTNWKRIYTTDVASWMYQTT